MSGIHNKNLLFYSLHPNDAISQECLKQIKQNPELDKQFIKICVHGQRDISSPPAIRLPQVVETCKQKGLIPILAIAGFSEPVFAKHALSWIKESALNNKSVMASNIHGGGVADSCCTVEQSEQNGNNLFDTEFNIGFSDGRGEFNKGYSSIQESCENRIVTYEESTDRKQAANDIATRLEQMKFQRDPHQQRQPQQPQQPQFQQPPPQMPRQPHPQMPQMPRQPHQQMPQMPRQQMPQMPRQPPSVGGGYMPQMPPPPPVQRY